MHDELTNAALALVAELPANASDLNPEDSGRMRALSELNLLITQRFCESIDRIEAMLALVRGRVRTEGGPPLSCDVGIGMLFDYLTADERRAFEDGERDTLDAERAEVVLDGWRERSGFCRMVEAAIGEPLAGPVEMTISEEPDGTLTYHFPGPTTSASHDREPSRLPSRFRPREPG